MGTIHIRAMKMDPRNLEGFDCIQVRVNSIRNQVKLTEKDVKNQK